jgi:rare lipoprotein A
MARAARLSAHGPASLNPSRRIRRAAAGGACLGAAGVLAALALTGCAAPTSQQHYAHGNEYFSQKKYGHASQKVVADGDPVPKGGGQYLVGHAYHVAGHTYVPSEMSTYTAVGMASWYGAAFHGRRTANGEVYDMGSITAAHPTMPLPSYARVTNLDNGYSVIVRVNDRGPYHGGRVMDVSSRAADVLDFKGAGTARVKIEYVGRAPLEGSDDSMLLASLRTDGSAASIDGIGSGGGLMVAAAGPLGGLFGAQAPATQPAAYEPPPAPAPAPAPPPEPAQVAAADPPQAPDEAPSDAAPVRQPRRAVPLPPPRPFDLGEAASRTSVVMASPARNGVLPPPRPELHASAEKALYFADPSSERVKRLTRAALATVKPPRRDEN